MGQYQTCYTFIHIRNAYKNVAIVTYNHIIYVRLYNTRMWLRDTNAYNAVAL